MSSTAAADNTKKGQCHHESALMAAAHILACLTKKGKSIDDIAKDFDNNLKLEWNCTRGATTVFDR